EAPIHGDRYERWMKRVGYVMAGLALLGLAGLHQILPLRQEKAMERLLQAGRRMAPGCVFEKAGSQLRDGSAFEYFKGQWPAKGIPLMLLRTQPLAGDIHGYGGPMDLALLMTADGEMVNCQILESNETPSYVARLRDWMAKLMGKNIRQKGSLAAIDGLSGATATTRAICRILARTGGALSRERIDEENLRHDWLPDPAVSVFMALLAGALVMRRYPMPAFRRVYLVVVLLLLGWALNMQYSLFHVFSLFTFQLPEPGLTLSFVLAFMIPIMTILLGNIYCGHLCPFGALQELLGEWTPASWRLDPDKLSWRWARWFKYLLLFIWVSLFIYSGASMTVAEADPLVSFFSMFQPGSVWFQAILLMAPALVFRRFWCRNLCPTGAFLSLLSGARLLRKWLPVIRPNLCDLGVRHHRDLDCIACDRCRMPALPLPTKQREAILRGTWLFLLVAIMGLILCHRAMEPLSHPWNSLPSTSNQRLRVGEISGMPRQVDEERMKSLIKEGQLSDHKALYYSPRDKD
ncbi:MAG: 4Fe-4S binding protein, partial [Lentisphaerota bacterium]